MKRRVWSWVTSSLAAVALAGNTAAASSPPSQRPVVVHVSDGGFHWGDAAIGAAGALGLTMLVVAWIAWGLAGLRAQTAPASGSGRD